MPTRNVIRPNLEQRIDAVAHNLDTLKKLVDATWTERLRRIYDAIDYAFTQSKLYTDSKSASLLTACADTINKNRDAHLQHHTIQLNASKAAMDILCFDIQQLTERVHFLERALQSPSQPSSTDIQPNLPSEQNPRG